jgi:hypothetical protein
MKRRSFLAAGLSLPFAMNALGVESVSISPAPPTAPRLSDEDKAFLGDMQRRCYQYFLDGANPKTGLIADRGATNGSWFSSYASSAACGFGLAAHCVAAEAGWASRSDAAERVRTMLRSLHDLAEHENGFVYHFIDTSTGRRAMDSEASSIDTALMLTGAVNAAVTFSDDPQIVSLSESLYQRVDWRWMLGENLLMHMGWTPESGMMSYQWDSYSELIILVLMAIGAPMSPIPPTAWESWRREPVLEFDGEGFLSYPPLFVHQYPLAFFDFRNYNTAKDRNFFNNAVRAHRAHIAFLSELGRRNPERFGHYGPDLWGLTSSDSVDGYRDWGGPYAAGRYEPDRGIDGTVVPSAAAGGLAIVPTEALHTLRYQKDHFGDRIYGMYGFANAHNPATQWVSRDVIGIDTGISLLMAENLRTGGVWNAFMQHPAAIRAMKLAGFANG